MGSRVWVYENWKRNIRRRKKNPKDNRANKENELKVS